MPEYSEIIDDICSIGGKGASGEKRGSCSKESERGRKEKEGRDVY
jgi:hypothetical protein